MITDTEKLLTENKRLVYELRKAEEMRKCYKHNLQLCSFQEKQIGKLADAIMKIGKIVSGNYEALDSQALQDIRKIIKECENEQNDR